MDAVFIKFLNMSITASWLVLAVILLRFLLKKAPKWIMGVLWSFVAIRLICPFSFESIFSLIPSAEPIPQNITVSEIPAINSGLAIFNQTVNPILADSLTPNVGDSVNPMQIIAFIASVIWIIGIIAMLTYTLVSYMRICRQVREAVNLQENIWICDHISTPFILGIIRPRIYLPSSMNESDMRYAISHEKAHLKRKDYIWKPLGFLLLSVYWFNPILWLAYILLCKDIEFACDEKVIRQFGAQIKKPYSDALINCSISGKTVSACPLAFGETSIKERVNSVLNYKKTAFWIILTAVVACILTAVCLLTDPISKHTTLNGYNYSVDKYYYTTVIETDKADRISADCIYSIDKNFNFGFFNGDDWSYEGILKTQTDTEETEKLMKEKLPLYYQAIGFDKIYAALGDYSYIFAIMNNGDVICAYIADYQNPQQRRIVQMAKLKYDSVAINLFEHSSIVTVNPFRYSLVYSYVNTQTSLKDSATLALEPQSKQFSFSFSLLSSYFAVGTYEEDSEFIIAHSDDGKYIYTFKKSGRDLIFIADKSAQMPSYAHSSLSKAEPCVPDGAVFKISEIKDTKPGINPSFSAEVLEVYEKSILVKPDADSGHTDKITVSSDVISTIPVPELKVGDKVKVVYNGEIAETYPAQINKVFAIYLLDDNGAILNSD